jgi:glycerol-3-phosphate acyltransferase PlsY
MAIRFLAVLLAVALALSASVAFSRLRGVSAVAAMAYAIAAVLGLTFAVFLLFTWLTTRLE